MDTKAMARELAPKVVNRACYQTDWAYEQDLKNAETHIEAALNRVREETLDEAAVAIDARAKHKRAEEKAALRQNQKSDAARWSIYAGAYDNSVRIVRALKKENAQPSTNKENRNDHTTHTAG